MIVMLEGVDKTGKTTLAKKLVEEYGLEYVKVSQPQTNNAFAEYVAMIHNLDVNKDYILDRAYLGQRVYGPVYRGEDLTDAEQLYLEWLLQSKGGFLIYCARKRSFILQSFKDDGEDFTKPKDIMRLKNLFRTALHKSCLPILRYESFKFKGLDSNLLLAFIATYRHSRSNFKVLPGIGNKINPKVILLGDELNENVSPALTFFSRSGLFLAETFCTYGRLDRLKGRLLIMNSTDLDKVDDAMLMDRPVIALGKNAATRLKLRLGDVPFDLIEVAHPQYALRFYGERKKAVARYRKEITYALKKGGYNE